MPYTFRPLTDRDARQIVRWNYDGEYAFYDMAVEAVDELIDPAMAYFAVEDEHDLVGFFGYGVCGQTPGGQRAGVYNDDALDVALGLRPDLTGRGSGQRFVEAGLAFGRQRFKPTTFRLTVASFNRRAIQVYERVGFRAGPRFLSPVAGREAEFVLMTRQADVTDVDERIGQ